MKSKSIVSDFYCLLGCIFLYVFGGGFISFVGLLCTFCMGGLMFSELKVNKWERLFLNCGLFNGEKKTPTLVKKTKNDIGDKYIFKLPFGLCLTDFEKCKTEIETALHRPVILALDESYNLVIQIFNVAYKSCYKPYYKGGE